MFKIAGGIILAYVLVKWVFPTALAVAYVLFMRYGR